MNIFLYVIIFITGTVFGSFYTLAVYRIPKNIDIIKKHSYCPNCEHKLGFWELIPVLSYILLGGKCKHCKQKIRIRYLILELLGGVSFVVLALSLSININTLNLQTLILYALTILYFTAVVLIMGIDKEYIKIDKRVLAYGVIISILYMIYLYTIGITSIYRYAIYLAIYVILLSYDAFLLKKKAEENYIIDVLIFLNIIQIFTKAETFILTVLVTAIAILIYVLNKKIVQKKEGNKKIKLSEMPIGYLIGISNIAVLFIVTFITNYVI